MYTITIEQSLRDQYQEWHACRNPGGFSNVHVLGLKFLIYVYNGQSSIFMLQTSKSPAKYYSPCLVLALCSSERPQLLPTAIARHLEASFFPASLPFFTAALLVSAVALYPTASDC